MIDSTQVGPGNVALVGIPWDEHSSFLRGAAEGPERVRAVMNSGMTNLCAESGVDLGATGTLVDVGDVPCDAGAMENIESAVASLLERGAGVVSVGGDHAVTVPVVRAHARSISGLTILHLDAHPDLYDEYEGDRLSHACPFARICEEKLARRVVQVGIRTMNPHQREQAERFGVEVVPMRDFRPDLDLGLEPPVYVSIDLDVLDPCFAPGVSHHEPGGMSVRDLLMVLERIPVPIAGADVVELNPRRDRDDRTAAVAFKLVKELAVRIER